LREVHARRLKRWRRRRLSGTITAVDGRRPYPQCEARPSWGQRVLRLGCGPVFVRSLERASSRSPRPPLQRLGAHIAPNGRRGRRARGKGDPWVSRPIRVARFAIAYPCRAPPGIEMAVRMDGIGILGVSGIIRALWYKWPDPSLQVSRALPRHRALGAAPGGIAAGGGGRDGQRAAP